MVQKTPNLNGKTIAITRPVGQTEEAGKLIRGMGGIPYYIPAIEIKSLRNLAVVKKFISELAEKQINYVIFMSTNGVKYLFEAAEELRLALKLQENLSKTLLIAVGPRTAEALKKRQLRVDRVPTKYSSEGLLESFQNESMKGKKIRIPRTSNATPTLTDQLRKRGAEVEEVYVYESGLPMDVKLKSQFYEDLKNGRIDALVFGSGLSAKNIFKMLAEKAPIKQIRSLIKEKVTTVAIGPTTAEALEELQVEVDVIPEDYLFERALSALAQFWAKTK
jgi:uroporphyrinogen-III synthase